MSGSALLFTWTYYSLTAEVRVRHRSHSDFRLDQLCAARRPDEKYALHPWAGFKTLRQVQGSRPSCGRIRLSRDEAVRRRGPLPK